MKYAALAVVVALLVANVALYPLWTADEDDDEWTGPNGSDGVVPIDAISVQVPPARDGDILQYDYEFLAELYEINKSSGDWFRMTLEANGQLLEQMAGPVSHRDGFHQPHQAWQLHTEISLSVKITVISHEEGESNEPLIVLGRMEGGRDTYATLMGDIPIMNYAGGVLAVDDVKGLDLPVSNFQFSVDNWAYPDPHLDPERPLEETLYGEQATLTEGMNGTYGETDPLWNYTQWYNWSLDASERVNGYDSLRLNISLDFFGEITLDKLVWLSSDVPRPVRVKYESSTYWDEENATGHLILDTDQVLIKDGYSQGASVIPIDLDIREPFVDRHPKGDFRSWEMAPEDGPISASSFDLGLQEAIDTAMSGSTDLRGWVSTHPNPFVADANYWANQTDQRTMEYTWNITLADEAKDWYNWEDWYPTNAYSVNVTRRVVRRPVVGDEVTTFIASEHGAQYGHARVPEEGLADQMVTLKSSEDIWSSISRVASEAYKGVDREVDFTDASYLYILGGIDVYGGFGLDLLDTLTGITVPNADASWSMQLGGVWEGASTFITTLDAETGRVVLINSVDGPQSLEFLFGNL